MDDLGYCVFVLYVKFGNVRIFELNLSLVCIFDYLLFFKCF